MTALAADRNTPRQEGEFLTLPVEAAKTIYAGAMVARNAAGNAVPASDTAGLVVLGRAEHRADNAAGAAGDKTIRIRFGQYAWSHSGLTSADIGKPTFVADDQTVALTSTNGIFAGVLINVDDEGAWVDMDPDDRAAAAQADSTAADVAGLKTDFNALLAKLRASRVIAS